MPHINGDLAEQLIANHDVSTLRGILKHYHALICSQNDLTQRLREDTTLPSETRDELLAIVARSSDGTYGYQRHPSQTVAS